MERVDHADSMHIGFAPASGHALGPYDTLPPGAVPVDLPRGLMPAVGPELEPPSAYLPPHIVSTSSDEQMGLPQFICEGGSILRYGPGTEPGRKGAPPPPPYYSGGYTTRNRALANGPSAHIPAAAAYNTSPSHPPPRASRYASDSEGEREGPREKEATKRKGRTSMTSTGNRGSPYVESAKSQKGPQPGYKNTNEPKRTPTLGQMAAQVQAHAQAKARASGMHDDDSIDVRDLTPCPSGQEHTGRWTRTEHDRFLSALKRYGKEWKKVASAVRTRTVVQTRTHAQKYFQKLQKQMATGMDLEQALETTQDVSDEESEEAGHKKRRKSSSAANARPAPRAPSQRRAAAPPPSAPRLPPSRPSTDYTDDDDDDEEEYSARRHDDDTYGSITDDDETDDRAAEAIRRVAATATPPLGPHPPLSTALAHLRPYNHDGYMSQEYPGSNNMLSISIPPHVGSTGTHKTGGGAWEGRRAPQPSPAACGKRKHAELAVAEVLAAAAQSDTMDAIDVLSQLRGGCSQRDTSPLLAGGGGGDDRLQRRRLDLTIRSPEEVGSLDNPHRNASGAQTPWDAEVRALAAFLSDNNSVEESGALPVSALQVEILGKIEVGDVDGVRGLLDRAKAEGMSAGARAPTPAAELDIHTPDANGRTALIIAAALDSAAVPEQRALELCQLLVENAALVSATDNNHCTALHWAARQGNAEVVRFLVSRGCPLNTQNVQGDTPLHWAAKASKTAVIKALIENGAAAHMRNIRSQCALDVAAAGFTNESSTVTAIMQQLPTHALHDATAAKMEVETSMAVPHAASHEQREEVRRTILESEPRLRTLIVYHPECLEHQPSGHEDWEVPARVEGIMERLRDTEAFLSYALDVASDFDRASVEAVSKVHSPDYLHFLHELSKEVASKGGAAVPFKMFRPSTKSAAGQGMQTDMSTQTGSGDSNSTSPALQPTAPTDTQSGTWDRFISSGSLNAARRSAGAVICAVDQVVSGRNRNAFCAIRPPGHHAGPNGMQNITASAAAGCGLNLLNNVAIGAMRALERCERVAIIDIDAHHGDGTEQFVRSFRESNRLMFFSIHLHDKDDTHVPPPELCGTSTTTEHGDSCFYPGTGESDDIAHNIYNVALTPLWSQGRSDAGEHKPSGRRAFRHAVMDRLIPTLRSFNPKLILLSTGLDVLTGDVGSCRRSPPTSSTPHVDTTTTSSGSSGVPYERGMDLTVDDITWVTRKLQGIADICCNGRMISVLEGGFGCADNPSGSLNRTLLSTAAAAHVSALMDPRAPPHNTDSDNHRETATCPSSGLTQLMLPPPTIAHAHDTTHRPLMMDCGTSPHTVIHPPTTIFPISMPPDAMAKVEGLVKPSPTYSGFKTRQ